MSTTASGSLSLASAITEKDPFGIVVFGASATIKDPLSYASGLFASQINMVAGQVATIAGPLTVDLQAIEGQSGLGRVREFIVYHMGTPPDPALKVSQGASDGWAVLPAAADALTIPAGGSLRLADPRTTGPNAGYLVGDFSRTITFDLASSGSISLGFLAIGCDAAA